MKYHKDTTPKPVEKIELNEKYVKLRFILFIISFCVVIVCAILIFIGFSKEDKGWTEIEASPVIAISCGDDFYLSYNLGKTEESATAEGRKLSALYTEKLEEAYLLFDRYNSYENINNVKYINDNINQNIQVSDLLYESLAEMLQDDNDLLYLAPIYSYYDTLIVSSEDELQAIDPYKNDNVKEYFNQILEYIENDHIKLNLLGSNTVNLNVSNDYLAFLNDNELYSYIDFGWMKNAYIVDYVSKALISEGYVNGVLSSYDGFTKNLDINNRFRYSVDILDNVKSFGSLVGKTVFEAPISSVAFKNFMYYQNDLNRYIKLEDGSTRNYYIDINDGLSKSAVNYLYSYSTTLSCSQIALSTYFLYINDSFNYKKIESVDSIWCTNSTIYYTDSNIELNNFYSYNDVTYKGELVQ